MYATEIAEGHHRGPYRSADAHDFARCLLMPTGEFLARARWPDHELAEHFAAPIDQVAIHRRELTACRDEHGWTHPPRRGAGRL